MPGTVHEGLVHLFHNRPDLVTTFISATLGVRLPPYDKADLSSADLPDLAPTEYRADAVITLNNARGPATAIVVEIQLSRDANKRYSWPVYLCTLRARLRCPVLLLVVCPTQTAATWCSRPIDCGHPGWILRPLVIGPKQIPVLSDPLDAARSPELTVLSAVAHGSQPGGEKVLHAVVDAVTSVDEDRGSVYYDIVLAALPQAARDYLEKLMTTMAYQFRSEFALRNQATGRAEGRAEGKAEGKAEGEAEALLTILDARGFRVPNDVRERIIGCSDLTQLQHWLRKAITINTIDDLFT